VGDVAPAASAVDPCDDFSFTNPHTALWVHRCVYGFVGTCKFAVVGLGLLAAIAVMSTGSAHPPLRIVQVTGNSMTPTYLHGEQLVFTQANWRVGSVVLADVGDGIPVIKRIEAIGASGIHLVGDNPTVSLTYTVPPSAIVGTCALKLPFTSPIGIWAGNGD
jgi:hypothetical protein